MASYTSPILDRIDGHPWLQYPDNRKILLQNLPEEYRWLRTGVSSALRSGFPNRHDQILYPSDWHNVVEYMLTPRNTRFLIAMLAQVARKHGLASTMALRLWRTTVGGSLIRGFRSSASTMISRVVDPIDQGWRPAVRTERWSQRVRSQKALVKKVAEAGRDQQGITGYWNPMFDSSTGEMLLVKQTGSEPNWEVEWKLAKSTLEAWGRIRDQRDDIVPNHQMHLTGAARVPTGFAADSGTALAERALMTPSGKTIILPREFDEIEITKRKSWFEDNRWELNPYLELPMAQHQAGRYALANGAHWDHDDLLGYVQENFDGFTLLDTKAAPPPRDDPKRKFAVPETFSAAAPEPEVEPEPEWAPPPMPGVGG